MSALAAGQCRAVLRWDFGAGVHRHIPTKDCRLQVLGYGHRQGGPTRDCRPQASAYGPRRVIPTRDCRRAAWVSGRRRDIRRKVRAFQLHPSCCLPICRRRCLIPTIVRSSGRRVGRRKQVGSLSGCPQDRRLRRPLRPPNDRKSRWVAPSQGQPKRLPDASLACIELDHPTPGRWPGSRG